MRLNELRCPGPHPTVPGWQCRAKLATPYDAREWELKQSSAEHLDPGCIRVRCWRCGTDYDMCLVEVRESA